MKYDHVKKLGWKNISVGSACLALATILLVAGTGAAQEHSKKTDLALSIERLKTEALDRVGRSPAISIEFTNFEVVPVSINNATVKEIDSSEFFTLTGANSGSFTYTTFPEVTLTNTTAKRVTGLVLMVGNKQTRKIHGVNLNRLSIVPGESLQVRPTDWVRSERNVRIADSGKITKQINPGFDSDRMWWSGAAREMVLRVGMVIFEDGSRWTISRDLDPW